jgi:Ca2+-binding RTX toxin-like protein
MGNDVNCGDTFVGSGAGGNDKINGGQGDVKLTGCRGADTFNCGNGSDTITDFNEAEGDKANRDCENVSRG